MIINTLALDPSGRPRLVTSGWDGKVKLWDVSTLGSGGGCAEVSQVELGFYVNHLAWERCNEDQQENVVVYAGGKEGNLVKIQL